MPRTARASVGGVYYHVISRGNRRARTYSDDHDYRTFVRLVNASNEHVPMRVSAYCLMPNHFHLVVRPLSDRDLGHWMHWLLTSYVRRYHKRHGTDGRLWQGRFKAFPIQDDRHLLTVVRYVERNPLRAGLVSRAEGWRWSSLGQQLGEGPCVRLSTCAPRTVPAWVDGVNQPLTAVELAAVRKSVRRGSPFGSEEWQYAIAAQLGLESTLRDRGRPRLSDRS